MRSESNLLSQTDNTPSNNNKQKGSKLKKNKNITYKNYDSKSMKKGNDTRAHRSLKLLPELE
jgi:hypothetical protein